MKIAILPFWWICLIIPSSILSQSSNNTTKPRIIITADPELDDNNSLIRFLLYSKDLDIEGLIYASSQFHWKGDGEGTKWFVPGREYDRFNMNVCPCESWRWAEDERFIHDIVDAYEKVYSNLIVHHSDYPTPKYLRSKIRYGNIEFDGDISKDSPGSDLIKSIILDDEPGQLFITAWGGASTIARALKAIQTQYQYTAIWNSLYDKISRKVVLLPSGDQDNTYETYIQPNWPKIEYRQFINGPNYGYGAQINASAKNAKYMTPKWMRDNILNQGPLGALYRVWGDGKQMVKGDKVDYFGFSGFTDEELREMGYFVWMPVQEKGSWLSEGDNHTFMNVLDNGLRAYEHGSYGGWGGYSSQNSEISNVFSMTNQADENEMAQTIGKNEVDNNGIMTYPNFFPMAQQNFASRLIWSMTDSYADANHEPVLKIQGPLTLLAAPGQSIPIYGYAFDPDGDEVIVKWWQMPVGSCKGQARIDNADSMNATVNIPEDIEEGQTIHIILEATDNGTPSLTQYQRVVITGVND